MKGSKVVVGVFTYIDDLLQAVEGTKKKGLDYRVYAPVPHHEIEEAIHPEKSPVRFVTITGALLGLTFGFALPILCSLDYPIRVSAKDIVSIPGFFVIGYECTILFGGVFTFLALLHFCRLPDLFRKVGFDPRFTQDKFGLVVGCDREDAEQVSHVLNGAGADEVSIKDGL